MVGQFQKSTSDDRNPDKFKKHSDYWNWLSHQKPGQTLLRAIELNPTDVQLLANLVEISSGNLTAFQFSGSNRELNQAWLRERVARKLIKIEANEDSRSCLIRYRFQRNNGNLSQGLSDLARGFEKAANRLQDPVDLDELIVEDQQSMWLDSFLPSTFWDYMLVKELGTSTSDSTVATKCFASLRRSKQIGSHLKFEKKHVSRPANTSMLTAVKRKPSKFGERAFPRSMPTAWL
jgi:hypothetical protein